MAHKGSFINISGNNEQLANELSLELKVTKDTPPAFIWSTNNDESVPCENSILMALAYRKAGVPMELHIFEPGPHGLSTCDEEVYTPEPTVRQWIKLSKVWLENRGFTVKNF
jgi:acetyl esterase/lipase